MISGEDIIKRLEALDAAKGRPVLVHTSLRAVGPIEGGGEALLAALIAYFTKEGGLLCVPTHTWNSTILDLNKAQTCLGALPGIAAAHPEGVRSMHPTHSMVVFGNDERIEDFVRKEGAVDTPTSPEGCYGNLYREDGYVLLIGVGHEKNTFLHCVEEMLGVKNRLTKDMVERSIVHKDGRVEKRFLHWFDEEKIPDVSVYFGKFEPAFRYHGCITDGFIGNARVQLCSARRMKDVVELIYQNSAGKELLADHLPLEEGLYKGYL